MKYGDSPNRHYAFCLEFFAKKLPSPQLTRLFCHMLPKRTAISMVFAAAIMLCSSFGLLALPQNSEPPIWAPPVLEPQLLSPAAPTVEIPLPQAPAPESGAPYRAVALFAPQRIHPGEPLEIWAAGPFDLSFVRAELRDRTGKTRAFAAFFEASGVNSDSRRVPFLIGETRLFCAFIAVAFDLQPGEYSVNLVRITADSNGSRTISGVTGIGGGLNCGNTKGEDSEASSQVFFMPAPISVFVEGRTYRSHELALDAANTALRNKRDPKKEAEAITLYAIYAKPSHEARFLDTPFVSPVGDAPRSAEFGDRWKYLYADGGVAYGRHYGVDFAVPIGTAIRAAGRGQVVFAGTRIVTGNTLVIEHLPGLYSVYMHLSEIFPRVGDLVERGSFVARSGNSGLSTGPHLHWEIRVGEIAVDPFFWTDRGPLDKDAIKAKITPAIEGR